MTDNKKTNTSKQNRRGFLKLIESNMPRSAGGNIRMPYVYPGGYITYIVS